MTKEHFKTVCFVEKEKKVKEGEENKRKQSVFFVRKRLENKIFDQ